MKDKILQNAQLIPTVGMDWLEMGWLYDQAFKMHSVLEIGSWMGRSTYVLASACPGIVYAVDHFKGSEEIDMTVWRDMDVRISFCINTMSLNNLVVAARTSKEAAKLEWIPKKVDMIFIDGSHQLEDVRKDLTLWVPRTTRLISGHDYHPGFPGVVQALEEYFPKEAIKRGAGTIWYVEVGP